MNKLVVIETVLLALALVVTLAGLLSPQRAGWGFLAVGIINLALGLAAWRRWPIIRGDIADQAPLGEQDMAEARADGRPVDRGRSSTGFALSVTVVGIIAIGLGLLMIWFS